MHIVFCVSTVKGTAVIWFSINYHCSEQVDCSTSPLYSENDSILEQGSSWLDPRKRWYHSDQLHKYLHVPCSLMIRSFLKCNYRIYQYHMTLHFVHYVINRSFLIGWEKSCSFNILMVRVLASISTQIYVANYAFKKKAICFKK